MAAFEVEDCVKDAEGEPERHAEGVQHMMLLNVHMHFTHLSLSFACLEACDSTQFNAHCAAHLGMIMEGPAHAI